MLSPNGKLTPMAEINRIEAMDAVANLRDIYALLKKEESDEGQQRLVRSFPLRYARAADVRDQLETCSLGASTVSRADSRRRTRNRHSSKR